MVKVREISMHSKNLVAHRGDNTNHPENTLIAIETALKAGATSFEFDVQMNADQSLVAFHDANFLRMNGQSEKKIFEVSDAEMAQISIHEPNQFGQAHYSTSVNFLDEITALLKRYPTAQAYVEIKDESLEFWGVELVMSKLLKSLEGFEQQVVIISFNKQALDYTKAHSKLRIGLVFEEYSASMKAIATELNPEFLICYYRILPSNKVWSGDWNWMVYTINNIDLAKRILKRGDIDFVETDDIQMMLNA